MSWQCNEISIPLNDWSFTIAALFAEGMCKRQQEYIKLIFRVLFRYTTPLPLRFFYSLSRSHIAHEMLTYCHAPAHSCSRLIPCEDRALTIRGFSSLHRPTQRCKVFLQAVNVNCLQITLDCLFISRKGRKERRDLFPFIFHACAGVVANFVTTRVRREFYPPPPPCGVLPLSQG